MKFLLPTIPLITVLLAFTAHADSEISIGALFTLTGYGAAGGTEELNGLELAKEQINAAGGIKGKKVRLVIEDGQSDAKTVTTAFKKLAAVDNVAAVVGPNWAEFGEAVAPLSDSLSLPTISPTAWKDGLLQKHRYFYSLNPPHSRGMLPLVTALKGKQVKRVVWIVSQNTFFLSIAEAAASQMPGLELNERIEVLPTTTDFRSLLSKITSLKPDVVVALLQEGGGLTPFLKQYKDLRLNAPLFISFLMYHSDQDVLLPLAEGIPSLEFLSVGTTEFKDSYERKFGIPPGGGSARAYDALFMIKESIERCGESRSAIQECLPGTDMVGAGGRVRFGPSRENIDTTPLGEMLMVKGGGFFRLNEKLEPTEPFRP